MKRDSFIFYRSFFEAIKELPSKNQAEIFFSISNYSLNRVLPDLKGISKTVWILILPQLEANNRRFDNGSKGGRPNLDLTEQEPKRNLNVTKHKPNSNVNDNVNNNSNENDNINVPFTVFWDLYEYKKNAVGCKKIWDKLSDDVRSLIILHVPKYVLSTPDKQYRKHPKTYLNSQAWNDEVVGITVTPIARKLRAMDFWTHDEYLAECKKQNVEP